MFAKIKKIFSKKTALFKKEKDYSINPDRDWKVISILFFILIVIISIYLLITFRNFVNGSAFNENVIEKPTEILDENAMKKVLEIYSKKEEQLNILFGQAPTVSDPSI